LFKNLIFSLVSEESSFYAPYIREMQQELMDKPNEPPKVQISIEDAMKDLGI